LTKRGFFLSPNGPGGEIGRHAGLKLSSLKMMFGIALW
jgi:hypothetical protein